MGLKKFLKSMMHSQLIYQNINVSNSIHVYTDGSKMEHGVGAEDLNSIF